MSVTEDFDRSVNSSLLLRDRKLILLFYCLFSIRLVHRVSGLGNFANAANPPTADADDNPIIKGGRGAAFPDSGKTRGGEGSGGHRRGRRRDRRNTEDELMRKTPGAAVGRRAHQFGRPKGGSEVVKQRANCCIRERLRALLKAAMDNEITLIIHASHKRENRNCEEIRLNLTFKPSNGHAEPPAVDPGLDNFIIIFPIYVVAFRKQINKKAGGPVLPVGISQEGEI